MQGPTPDCQGSALRHLKASTDNTDNICGGHALNKLVETRLPRNTVRLIRIVRNGIVAGRTMGADFSRQLQRSLSNAKLVKRPWREAVNPTAKRRRRSQPVQAKSASPQSGPEHLVRRPPREIPLRIFFQPGPSKSFQYRDDAIAGCATTHSKINLKHIRKKLP
jgi:hypothetical protein